eukprot:s1711_g4.t1
MAEPLFFPLPVGQHFPPGAGGRPMTPVPWLALAVATARGTRGTRGTRYAPVELCFDVVDSTAWSCCDTKYGPRGRNSCFDDTFNFERCCREMFDFDLTHCCGSSSKCLDFSFKCVSGPQSKECWIRPRRLKAMRQHLRKFGSNATTCDDGSALFPPRYIAVQEKRGDVDRGHQLSLKGTIFQTDKMMKTSKNKLPRLHQPVTLDPCLGEFLRREQVFGTCIQSHHTKSPGHPFRLSQPLRDLPCAKLCKAGRCKIYAAVAGLAVGTSSDLEDSRLILAVPKACSNGDVAFRVLPHVVSQRSQSGEVRLAEVRLHHFEPGDPCEHRGRPEPAPILLTSLVLLMLPRLWRPFVPRLPAVANGLQHSNGKQHPETNQTALDAVNLIRVVALWHTCCVHWEMQFPFKSFCKWLARSWWADEELEDMLQVRLQTSLEGLYVMITLFLVLQCRSWKMFCQRLVRKVGRQLVVMYFIASVLPLLLYTSSPMNCLQEPTLNPAVVARSAKNFLFGGKDWVWAIQMDLHIFLLIGSLGLLRRHLPSMLPASCVLYWAYILQMAMREGPCVVSEVSKELEDHTRWVTHFSFWLHWFPTSLLLLNLDTWLRKAHTIFLMGRLKQMLGKLLIIFIAVLLCFSYWISAKASLQLDWQSLGFSNCPMYCGGHSPSMPYVLAGLPFHLTIFLSLHLAAAPTMEPTPSAGPVATFCNAFRDTNLAFNIWHGEVVSLGKAHFPAWIELFRRAQREESTLEEQLLFFAPMVLGNFFLAWLTYHGLEKPWAQLLRDISERCPKVVLYVFSAAYFVMNHAVWYGNRFSWS